MLVASGTRRIGRLDLGPGWSLECEPHRLGRLSGATRPSRAHIVYDEFLWRRVRCARLLLFICAAGVGVPTELDHWGASAMRPL